MSKQTATVRDLFNMPEAGNREITIMGEFDHPYTPKIDPDFTPNKAFVRNALAFINHEPFKIANGFFYFGPSGTGKSTSIRDLSARLGIPLYEITCNTETGVSDIFGELTLTNNEVTWKDGPLVKAMRNGGIFCIHEISYGRPNVLGALNTVLDGGNKFMIPNQDCEIIDVHPDFHFFCTDNTNGTGDTTNRYSGTRPLNLAFLDRFMMVKAEYLPKQKEIEIVSNIVPNLSKEVIAKMVDFANKTRDMFNGTEESPASISSLITTRTLVMWAKLVAKFYTASNAAYYGLELSFINKLPQDEVEGVKTIFKTLFDFDDI